MFNIFIAKLLSYYNPNIIVISNLFLILSFFTSMFSALFVFRYYDIKYPLALFGALLFSLTHYHFARISHGHYLLASYFSIPIWSLVAINIMIDKPLILTSNRLIDNLCKFLGIVILGATGIYYAFFGCFFIVLACCTKVSSCNSGKKLIRGAKVIIPVLIVVALQLLPSLFYHHLHGQSLSPYVRIPYESLLYGLRLTTLFIPPSMYHSKRALGEDWSSFMGLVSICGFIYLLGCNFTRRAISDDKVISSLTTLNLGAILLGCVGGFGYMFANIISPQIRCYSRISIFIVFFALFALLKLIQNISTKNSNSPYVIYLAIALGVALSIPFKDSFTFQATETVITSAKNDSNFVHQLEYELPIDSAVFQLPYNDFPEGSNIYTMPCYENPILSFYSNKLFWSFAAPKGRPVAISYENTATVSVNELVQTLTGYGFKGVIINTHGYEDGGYMLIQKLNKLLHKEPLISSDKHYVFFSLVNYN